jgi:tetratricopeptide (TPR) repeat protein
VRKRNPRRASKSPRSKKDQAHGQAPSSIEREIQIVQRAVDLGVEHHSAGNLDQAEIIYQRILEAHPNQPIALNLLGLIAHQRGQYERAVKLITKALAVKPDYAEARNNLGNAFRNLGRLDEALTSYRTAISIDPEYAQAHRHLSRTKDFSEPSDPDLEAMEAAYAAPGASDEQKTHLAFGLGKACEDLKQFDKSFDYYATGNAIRNASFNYDEEEAKRSFATLEAVFTKEFFARHQGSGSTDATPLFVLGMPRTGTTLVEQILASHADVFGAGELHDLDRIIKQHFGQIAEPGFTEAIENAALDIYHDAGEAYLSCLKTHADGDKFITDKMPGNFQWIGMIKLMIPNAKVIHCRRNPMDTCLSIFKNYFSMEGLPYAYDLGQLGSYYRLYENLMDHWYEVLPGFIHEIKYENVVADQQRETAGLLNFCNLEWDDACLTFYNTNRAVSTASAAQVRKPIYGDSVERWRKYEKQLAPLIKALKL